MPCAASLSSTPQEKPRLWALITLFFAPAFVFANMYSTQAILPVLSSAFHVAAPTAGLTLVVLRALQGLLMPGLTSVAISYVNEEFAGKRLGLTMGIYVSGLTVGGLFARAGSAAVTGLFNWRIALLAFALPTLTNPAIYPYVDFISYHRYLYGSSFNGGSSSLLANAQDPMYGLAAEYEQVVRAVRSGKQPNAANTPIYIDEYKMEPCVPNVCRNDPVYSPLDQGLFLADYLNAVNDTGSCRPGVLHVVYSPGESVHVRSCRCTHGLWATKRNLLRGTVMLCFEKTPPRSRYGCSARGARSERCPPSSPSSGRAMPCMPSVMASAPPWWKS